MVKKRPRPKPKPEGMQTRISDRKTKRKEERKAKKKKPRLNQGSLQSIGSNEAANSNSFDSWTEFREKEKGRDNKEQIVSNTKSKPNKSKNDEGIKESSSSRNEKKSKKKEKKKKKKSDSYDSLYDKVDPNFAAAMRKDDEEISMLEKSLGIKSEKTRKKLNKEYAKLEGYGDDFGDFLDGLDGIMDTVMDTGGGRFSEGDLEGLEYDSDESDPAAARAKYLLRMEQIEGADFDENADNPRGIDSESEEDEEMVPMKGPDNEDVSESDSESDSDSDDGESKNQNKNREDNESDEDGDSSSNEDSEEDGNESDESEKDHDDEDTYRPVQGQDLYGNTLPDNNGEGAKPTKYIPPHLRKKLQPVQDDDDPERQAKLREINRLLNNNLNRLSDNTLESVSRAITGIYESGAQSSRDVNEKYWKNLLTTLVPPHMLMSTLIPLYIACFSGVHFQTGDMSQLGGFIIEHVILDLWNHLKKGREKNSSAALEEGDPMHTSKEASNLMMILCYLYNYNVVHCTLMYDVVRQLIKSFTEMDVELLLLILSHSGSQLRSDDPSSLRDIVLLVQERSMEVIKFNKESSNKGLSVLTSSRAQFMISAMTDLKNNKRKGKDISIAEKASNYRRMIGRLKSSTASKSGHKPEPKSLRITVQDVLDIETKGRWWVVGASWMGNQHRVPDSGAAEESLSALDRARAESISDDTVEKKSPKQDRLLKLATKQRMNTDLRRSIFCIIMGSDDCQDAFEKLIRAGTLRGKSEREVVRVLVHCCGQEKVYNPYYSHLAKRLCSYQNKCKFTFQLALWDSFKQFEDMKARKAANLAKLLAHLIMNHQLNLNVLKVIDISPNDMSEASVIFLTILFSSIFDSYEDPQDIAVLFRRGEKSQEQLQKEAADIEKDDLYDGGDNRAALKENMSVFLIHYLEKSPKNVKKSNFRKHLKTAIKICETESLDFM